MNDIPKEFRIKELDDIAEEIESLLLNMEIQCKNNTQYEHTNKIKFGGGENVEGYSVSTTPFNPITPKKDIPNDSSSEKISSDENNEIIKNENSESSDDSEKEDNHKDVTNKQHESDSGSEPIDENDYAFGE